VTAGSAGNASESAWFQPVITRYACFPRRTTLFGV